MITTFGPFTDDFFETGSQLHNWVMQRARQHFGHDRARRVAVVDAASFAIYKKERRDAFLASIGGLPEERTNLHVIETGQLQRQGYTVRKLIYQSLPSVYVTALLYVPTDLNGPAPAVLMGCGHHKDGKAAPKYQQVCIDLARAGFVVLIFDSPSQGEMVQCLQPGSGEPLVGLNTREHSYLQILASITGHNVARYFLWNAMRGIDLLTALPEVDAERIGATGNSGGGTLTQYLMMADPRVKAAMPCCSLSTREYYLATGSRAYDGEQNLFGSIRDGVDYADFLAAFAPRPVRVGAAEYDFFGIEGVHEAVAQATNVYRALGAEEAVDLCIAGGELHGYSAPLRRGCVAWFAWHLKRETDVRETEEPETEDPETLQCTQSGQVLKEFKDARSILDLNRDQWEQKRAGAPPPTRESITELLGPTPTTPLRVRRTFRRESEEGIAEHVFFFSEPGIITTAVVYSPPSTAQRAVVFLIPDGTEGQEPYTAEIRRRVAAGEMVMVFDVRGTGAVKMHRRNSGEGLTFRSTEFRVASDHFLLGTSLAARRTFDVRRALEYLRGLEDLDPAVPLEIVGYGWPSIYGLMAAVLEEDLAACSLEGLPATWGADFGLQPPAPEKISESLIFPELQGIVDIRDLLHAGNATTPTPATEWTTQS